MTKRQQTIAAVGVGAVVLFVLIRWLQSRQTPAAPADSSGASQTAGADYGQVAGGLQSLGGQETADYSAAQTAIAGLGSQEQSDIGGVEGEIAGLSGTLQSLAGTVAGLAPQDLTPLSNQVAALAAGETKHTAATAKQIKALQKAEQRQAKLIANLRGKGGKHTTSKTPSGGHHADSPHHPAKTGAGHGGADASHPHHGVQGAANGSKTHQSTASHAGSGAVAPNTHETKPAVKAHAATNVIPLSAAHGGESTKASTKARTAVAAAPTHATNDAHAKPPANIKPAKAPPKPKPAPKPKRKAA